MIILVLVVVIVLLAFLLLWLVVVVLGLAMLQELACRLNLVVGGIMFVIGPIVVVGIGA